MLRNNLTFCQVKRQFLVKLVTRYSGTVATDDNDVIEKIKNKELVFKDDNSDWIVHSNKMDFSGSEYMGSPPELAIDRPCNMRTGYILQPEARLKELLDNDGNVVMSEVLLSKRRLDVYTTQKKIVPIIPTPQTVNQLNKNEYINFITYLKMVFDSRYIEKKFTLVKIKEETYKNTCNVLISMISTKNLSGSILNFVDEAFDKFLKNKNIEKEIISMITELMLSIYPKETALLKQVTNLLWNLDIYKACGVDINTPRVKRKVYLHVGPTNSGKTYNAINSLTRAKSGIYCAPLRILAHEIYEKLKDKGKHCGLITGEEKYETYKTTHWSCTVEASPSLYDIQFDVGVIDEVQLAANNERGHAWVSAIVNLKVKELHLCGDPSICTILNEILTNMGDDVTYLKYKMLNKVVVSNKNVYRDSKLNLKPFDCVVAFNVKALYALKKIIESILPYRCAIIYGSMPHSSRIRQVNLFNDPDSPFKILMATDAIGMGLNLNIRRIVYYSTEKFDGQDYIHVPQSLIKQISGRCGRYSSPFKVGEVTAFNYTDLHYVRKSVFTQYHVVTKVGIAPNYRIISTLSTILPDYSFLNLLKVYKAWVRLPNGTFLCDMLNQMVYANLISDMKIGLKDAFKLCTLPIPLTKITLIPAFYKLLHALVRGEKCYVSKLLESLCETKHKNVLDDLEKLQIAYKVLNAYMLLSNEHPHIYHDTIGIKRFSDYITKKFDLILMKSSDILNENDYKYFQKLAEPHVREFIDELDSNGLLSENKLLKPSRTIKRSHAADPNLDYKKHNDKNPLRMNLPLT